MPELPPEVTPVRGGPGPFEGSPVTKALLFGSLVLSLTLRRGSSALSALAFATGGEIMVGSLFLQAHGGGARQRERAHRKRNPIRRPRPVPHVRRAPWRLCRRTGQRPYGPVFCLAAAFTLTVLGHLLDPSASG